MNNTKILKDNKDESVLNSHDQVQKELKSEIIGSNNSARDNELVGSNGQVQDDLKENNIVENNQSLKVKNSDNILGKNENDDKLMKVTFTVNSKAWNSISVSFVDDWVDFTPTDIRSIRSSSGTFTCNGISATASCSAQKMNPNILKLTASGTLSATSTKWFTPGQTYTISFSGTVVIEHKSGSKSRSVSGSTTVTIPKLGVGAVSCSLSTSSYTYGDGAVTLSGSIAGLNDKFSAGGTVNIYRNDTKIGSTTCAADGTFSYNVAAGSTTPAGKYQYWAEYMGNDYYNKASATSSKCNLQINKKATTGIDITPSITYQYASTNTVTLTGTVAGVVSSYSAGSVNIYRNGTKIGTATIGSTGAYTYTINTESVDEGNYVYWATYDGNTYYKAFNGTSNNASVTVIKGDITPTFSTGDIVYLNDKTLTVTLKNAKGTLIKNTLVTLVGNGIVGNLTATTNNNGVATFTISGLNASSYDDWQIHVDEFTNYNALNANVPSFKVTPATLTVTVTSNGDIDADEEELISVYIKNAKNENVKGMVAVVTGKDIPQGGISKLSSDGGVADFAIGNLNAITTYNDWIVTVYDPNGNYYNATKNVDSFYVNKGKPRLVIDAPAISFGADAIITIGLPDTANGTVKLYVGLDWNYTLNITNGEYSVTIPRPAAGSYQITAEYSGNDRWKPVTATSHLYVERPGAYTYIEVEDINYGQEALIKFSIYTNESRVEFLNNTRGSITVYGLNNASGYITNVNNGRAELRVKGLTRGTWNVVSYYSGDNEWKGGISTAVFNVNAIKTDLIITTNTTILTDSNLVVTVNVNNTINDTVYLYVDGKMYAVAFTTNGKALFNVYNLSAGSRNITAKFLANNAFDNATNSTLVNVNKRDVNYTINLTANRDIIFNITVDSDIKETLSIAGNGTSVSKNVVDGNVYYVIEKVTRGLYQFNITYAGNWKYNQFNTTRLINVNPVSDYILNITSDPAIYNETISFYVQVPDDLEGKTINLTLFGNPYSAVVTGGIATFNNIYLVNVTTGSFDVTAIYDGDDIYAALTNTTTIQVIPTSRYDIVVEVPDFVFVGDDAIINITAPNLINRVNITINGVRKEIPVGLYKLEKVSEGTYNVVVSYNGDNAFAAKNTTISSFNAIKHNITLTVTANDTIFGNYTTINVLLSNNVTGFLLIRLDGNEYLYVSLNNKNSAEIIDNTFAIGTHNLTVEFLGDTYYNSVLNSTLFNISKSNEYNMTVYQNNTLILNNSDVGAIEGDTFVLTVILPKDATGHVIVRLLKDNVQVTNWDLTLPTNLITYKLKDVGNYTVEIEYSGDTNYTDTNFNFNLNVTPKLIISNITFIDDNYFVLSDSVLNITTNLDNRTLAIFIDGIFYKNVTVSNLKASVNLAKLTAGNHTITVKFDSDEVFTSLYVSHDIFVNKLNSTVVVSAFDIDQGHMVTVDVVASGNGTANITIYNGTSILTGPFTIVINNGVGQFMVPYTFPIVNSYTINVTYNGDENYLTSTNSSVFNVLPSYDYLFDVITNDAYVGDDVVVNVTLPGNANQNVILTFENGTNVTIKAQNGSAVFSLANLVYGNYTVNVTYVGDYNYQRVTKQAKFAVDKRIILVNLTTNATDGSLAEGFIGSVIQNDNLNLTIYLADDATGKVNVYLNDNLVAENLDLVNGKVSTVLNGFAVGVDSVKVVYFGDDKYWNNTVSGNVLVAYDYGCLNVTVSSDVYVVDDNVDLIIKSNAGGNVSIYVNGELLETLWINRELTYTLNNVTYGDKNVLVILHANENYTGVFNNTNFTVIKKNTTLDVGVVGTSASLPVTVVITVKEGVTGWISAFINGTTPQTARALIENNQVALIFQGLEVGNHTVIINYEGDERFNTNTTNVTFTIAKAYYYPVNVTVEDVYVGDNATVCVVLPDGAHGLINITLNEQHFTGILVNSTVNITIPYTAINHEGKYNIVIAYNGSNEFNATTVTSSFHVYRISKYPFVVNVTDIKFTELGLINITLPSDINNTLIKVYINGKEYNVTVNDGNAVLELSDLEVGSKNVRVVFDGNYKYVGLNVSDRFMVSPKDVMLNVTVVVDTLNATVRVNATPGINETIHVYVGGLNKTVKLVNGIGSVLFSDLTSGNYTALVVFEGCENYTPSSNKTQFTIDKQEFIIVIDVEKYVLYDGESNTVTFIYSNVPSTDLIITVNGKSYPLVISKSAVNTTAVLRLDHLTEGTYNVSVSYIGDEFVCMNKSVAFNVYKPVVDASESIIVWDNANVTVAMPNNASGIVTVTVNGKNYNKTIESGFAVIDVPGLGVGTHTLQISYLNDTYYPNFSVNKTVVVGKFSDYIIVVESPVNPEVGVNNTIKVILPVNATGIVSVYLDGKLLEDAVLNGSVAVVSVDGKLLFAGNHTVRAVYAGDVNYTNSENSTVFNITKKDLTINITVTNIKVGDIETITVKLPKDAIGVILLTVNGTKYFIDLENGIGSINITKLISGNYSVIAVFEGNDLYNPVNNTAEFVVSKISDYEMNVTYTNVTNNATKVTVSLPDDATGLVTINVNGTNFTGVIYKGKAVIDVVNLTSPVYPYIAIWDGDEKYVNGSKSGVIYNTEYRDVSQVIVSVEDIFVTQSAVIKINVTAGATGTVRISVNGKNIVVPLLNSGAVYTLAGLGNGTYKVDVVYSGDDIYITSENSTTFNVNKYNSTINVAPGSGKVGENITVVVSGPSDANGTVEININGTKYTVDMINGTALLNVSFNKQGTYTVVADYAGNNKYNGNSSDSTIVVDPLVPSVNIAVSDIKVGENATVIVFVPGDATGNVTLEIISGSFTQTVAVSAGKAVFTIPGLGNGTYNIMATFNGDGKYDVMSNVSSFNVTKIDIVPDVRANPIVENKTNITVHVPNDVNGNLILVVGDRTITSPITDGTANFNLDNVGNGTNVNFVFDGDDKYNKFNISAILYDSGIKLSSALSIMISNILVGDNATITVGVTKSANGNITINIDGRTFTKVIQDGKVTFTVSDLAYGTYNVTATYSGDDKFLSSNITSSIFVAKYTSVVVVIVDDINVGDNATITVKVLDDATGNVSLKINGIGYDPVIISGGKAVFTISGLGNGTYTAVATYNGNAKYLNSTGNATFKVSKIDINPGVNSTSVLDNKTTVTVIVPGDATGNITIVVGGKNFTEAIDNGKAVINLNNVSDGTPISIVYAGDDKYNEFAVDAVITDQGVRLNPQVIVVSDKDKYLAGETAVITITVPNDAKGNVTIKIRGETVNISDISDGKVIYNYVVPTSGNFNVEVIYNGDNKYASERNTTSFTADKINATVIIDVNNTPVGKNVTVVVTVPNDATGNITITVGSTQYSKAIDNGTVVFNLPALDRDTYEVIANYEPLGDLKYLGGKNSTKFDVTGKSTSIEVTAEAITYGENAEIIVRVDSNATGHISITVGNDTYLGNIDNNGVARIIVPGLKPGVVNFEVSYDGDINFDGNSTASSVTVNRKTTNVEVSADNITDEETAVITVVVPSDATGTVTITVDGKNYTESVNNGVASFNITGLSAGRYLIDAVYNGDTFWNVGENATVWFTVRTSKTIHVETISRGYNSGLDYRAVFTDEFGNPLANTNVTFAVGGKEYTVLTDENGVANLNIGLAPGNHTIVAVNPVTGDESYNTTNIVPRLVENKPIVMDFSDGSKFVVRAIGDDGKPVGAGEKVLMFVNGITYEVITDETGLAELTINLNPNWYLITAQYKGYYISDNIEVKQILTAKKVQKVKKSKKKNKVKAKLRFSNGKPLSGVKVTMKIKSKIFTAKTNSKGVAKFKLSKKVVKKLKVGKKYRVTFTYLTNTINKHIKVKR